MSSTANGYAWDGSLQSVRMSHQCPTSGHIFCDFAVSVPAEGDIEAIRRTVCIHFMLKVRAATPCACPMDNFLRSEVISEDASRKPPEGFWGDPGAQ